MIRVFSQYVSPKSILLVVFEGLFITLGLFCGAWLRFWGDAENLHAYVGAPEFPLQAIFFVLTMQLCFYYSDLYDLNAIRDHHEELICLGQSLGAASLFLGMMYFIFPPLLIGRGVFFIGTAIVAAFALAFRAALDIAWRMAAPAQKVLILGSDKIANIVGRELARRSDLNMEVVGFLEPGRPPSPHPNSRQGDFESRTEAAAASSNRAAACCVDSDSVSSRPVLGTMADLEAVVDGLQIARIIVALEDRRGSLPIRDLVRLRVGGIRVEDAHSTLASLTGRIWLEMVRPSWFIFSDGFQRSRLTLVAKRIIDLGFGLTGLVFSLPIMALVAIAIRLDSPGPVLFSQGRVGYKGKTFKLLKFRSMRVDAEAGGAQWAQKNDSRVTRIGKYLRKFRLDELPQFVNVIRGDMSFVGPRPERPVFVERLRDIISYYDERHSVRPGLTGWAQVSYSYGASIEDAFRKVEYDLFYLKNMSIFFDLVIVLKTIRIILTGQGGQ